MMKLNYRILQKKIGSFPAQINYELIEKERVIETALPIYLKEDLDKVTKSPFGITLKQEFNELIRTTYTSGPFYHYQLKNILLLKNRIYFDKYEYLLNPLEKPVRIYNSKKVVNYSNAAFSSMRISTVFFGHWLHEELMLIDYLQPKKNIVTTSLMTPQKEEIKELFNLKFDVSPFAYINIADMYEGWQHSSIYVDVLKKYKEKISLITFKGQENPHRYSVVYLKRGPSGVTRQIANESDLLDFLSKNYDVTSYIAETTPIKELYAAIFNADLIIGVEGSQLAHAIVAGRTGAVLICIQPPFRFYNPFKNYCADAGLKYSIFVGEQSDNNNIFNVDIQRFKYLLNKVENQI